MNILKDEAGIVEESHILSRGFHIYDYMVVNDMGQAIYKFPQYANDRCTIRGGYWRYIVLDKKGKELWEGWWNTNDEFDQVMSELGLIEI